jgi:hypothetical protein
MHNSGDCSWTQQKLNFSNIKSIVTHYNNYVMLGLLNLNAKKKIKIHMTWKCSEILNY